MRRSLESYFKISIRFKNQLLCSLMNKYCLKSPKLVFIPTFRSTRKHLLDSLSLMDLIKSGMEAYAKFIRMVTSKP